MAEFTDWSDGAVGKLVLITGICRYRKKILHHFRYLQALSHRKSVGTNKAIWLFGGKFGYLAENLVIWRKIVWLFGGKLFGYLAENCLVIWRKIVWLFGGISFGYLAEFRLVVWR
ncbi:MAG: hypothetical protein PUH35_04835 [Bacteroidales bacterium]|uniref:hypothetical protein n=1 Tax=Candidatus Cryptobacteroides sp. TaxID=2952915 RepID=UPI002A763BE0|nr:hypothetical protein [Candidatus Cryptobacteroides sp.]MDD7234797.1 hypothetical protein [Bacteroidales bacterium]MDY2701081.1 hypothetical protein [Candidatus Cryptobacteroides sp.]